VFVDYDGTLSPIVEDFETADPVEGAVEVLAALSARMAKVAVISGRPVSYLSSHLRGSGSTVLAGLYGLEMATASGDVSVAPEAERWREPLAAVADAAEETAPEGLVVERKGLAVTLHYRAVPENAPWAERFAKQWARDTGLVEHPGKMSVELRPPVGGDKGTVVAELAEGLSAVCYIGDDIGDVPAFVKLRSLRSRSVATLAVAVESVEEGETPSALTRAADVVVEGPQGVLEFLRSLAG
jgi:trehalose 6-phosphate phosphatase